MILRNYFPGQYTGILFRYTALMVFSLYIYTGALAHRYVPGKSQDTPIALVKGDLYTVSGEVIRGGTILFDKGVITAIGGSGLPIPPGTQMIDVAGKSVYPGLIAPNSPLGLIEIGAVRASLDLAEVDALNPNVRSAIAYNADSEIIPTTRSNGITTALIVPRGSLLAGISSLVMLDGWNIEDAQLRKDVGMHLYWPRTTLQPVWRVKKSPEKQIEEMHKALQQIKIGFEKARQYYVSRKNTRAKNLSIDIRWEAMMPLFSGKMPLFVHADEFKQIEAAVHFCKQQQIRMILVGGADVWQLLPLIKANQIPVIVKRVYSLPAREDDDYDLPFKLPRILHDNGVKFCLSHSGSQTLRNLPFLAGTAVAFGLDKAAALRAITLWSAEILGVAERMGSLEVGKDATLIVSSGDILDVRSSKVEYEFIQGRAVDLNDRHKTLYQKYRQK